MENPFKCFVCKEEENNTLECTKEMEWKDEGGIEAAEFVCPECGKTYSLYA